MDTHHEMIMKDNYISQQAGTDSRLWQSSNDKSVYFVDASWLKHQMDLQVSNLVVVDVTRGAGNYRLDMTRTSESYAQGHIPGAVHLNTDELGGFKDYFIEPEHMKEVFLQKGITKDSLVVFYSAYARDIMYIASRMAFAAYYLGVEQVRILDGGLQAWERQGYPLEEGDVIAVAATDFACEVPRRPEILISRPADLVLVMTEETDIKLVSVRTWNEFSGKNQGHQWNKGIGEIAGAIYAGDELLANQLGEMAHPSVYLPNWEAWGIGPSDNIVLYCGTSWRSSTMFFLMKELGYEHVRMFDGSWYQWYLAHEENPAKYPIQLGDPRDRTGFRIVAG